MVIAPVELVQKPWPIPCLVPYVGRLLQSTGFKVPLPLPPNLVAAEARWLRGLEANKIILMIDEIGWATAAEVLEAFADIPRIFGGKIVPINEKQVGHLRDHLSAVGNAGILDVELVNGRIKKFRTFPKLEILVTLCMAKVEFESRITRRKLLDLNVWCARLRQEREIQGVLRD